MRNGRHRGMGILDELLRTARDAVAGSLVDTLKEMATEVLHESLTRIVFYVLAAGTMLFGAILLFFGILNGLRMIPMPEALACGIVGFLAGALGFVALRLAQSRR